MGTKKIKKGFTLVELLVVIGILALLLSILLPALNRAREHAKRAVCANGLRQIGLGILVYTERFNGSMPVYNSSDTEPYLFKNTYVVYKNDWLDAKGNPRPMKVASLFATDIIVEPQLFYCASNREGLYKFESYNGYEGAMSPPYSPSGEWPQGDPHNDTNPGWVRIGYTYYPIDPMAPLSRATKTPLETAYKIDRLSQRFPYMTDVIRHLDELSHGSRNAPGINALFADAHVVFCDTPDVFDKDYWDQWDKETETHKVEGVGGKRGFYYTIFTQIEP